MKEVDGHWQATELAACAGVAPGLPSVDDLNDLTVLALDVGPCWVEPVAAAGRTWLPTRDDQFGSGGMWPRDFRGVGTVRVEGAC